MMFDKIASFLQQFAELFRCWVVIDEYERGVLLRLGRFKRELSPGIHWCVPFAVDRVLHDNVVTRTHTMHPQSLTTKDQITVSVTAVVTASIKHIRKALLEVENMDHALLDSCSAAITTHVATHEWTQLNGAETNETLTKVCRAQAWRYGIEIERVQLADFARCRVIRLQTSQSWVDSGNTPS
jgi:regulator of protease activity HflC (stomatin/prohibitin superfamily)